MIFERFHALNIGKKLIFVIVISCLVVFLSMCAVIFALSKETSRRNIYNIGNQQISTGRRIADNACSYLRGIADIYSTDSFVQACANGALASDSEKNNAQLQQMLQSQRYVLNAIVYDLDGVPTCYMAIDGSQHPLNQAGREPFETLCTKHKSYCWEYIDEDAGTLFAIDNSSKLCLWHVIKGSNNSSTVGIMAISIDIRRLLRFDTPYNSDFYRSYSILEQSSGEEVSNYTDKQIGPEEARELIDAVDANGSPYMIAFPSGRDTEYVFCARILDTPLYILCSIGGSSVGLYDQTLGLTMIVAIIAFLISTVPMLMYVYRRLTKPLELLTASMNSFAKGNFEAKLSFDSNDDIGCLAQTFNRMVEENHALIEKTYVSQLRAREAELQMLHSQINPHFIYNLTNSIQWAALRHGEQEIADTAHSLGQMLRLCLNRGKNIISVEQECDLVTHYLKLQKTRYRDRFEYEIDASDEALDALIPKLIIQPLVENSIVHGTKDHNKAMHLRISARIEGDQLLIQVDDDGSGIPAEILRQLPDHYESEHSGSSGYAIRNIHERLRLMYGQDFSFAIRSDAQQGTHISIRLPAKFAEEGEDIHVGFDYR